MQQLKVIDYHLADFHTVWAEQKKFQKKLINNEIDDQLLLCEHPLVITHGRSSKLTNILDNKKVPIIEIERGGDVTCHEPGQLVIYPIINLNRHKKDVAWYLRQLEEVILITLVSFDIKAIRYSGRTGVWIDEEFPTKIASIGIRISRWCTMHGFALNVSNDLAGFKLINPCGFTDTKMTSLNFEREKKELSAITIAEAKARVIKSFKQVFNYE